MSSRTHRSLRCLLGGAIPILGWAIGVQMPDGAHAEIGMCRSDPVIWVSEQSVSASVSGLSGQPVTGQLRLDN